MMTRQDILAVYEAGPEAVVALFEQMQQRLVALSARLRDIEARLGKDSHNSHKPPSSDSPFRKQTKSLRPASGTGGKKPGAQPGHSGQTLCQVARPDHRQSHRPSACVHCGHALDGVQSRTDPELAASTHRRQVFDLPPLALRVTEHEVLTLTCPQCHGTTTGAFPDAVSQPTQYGPGVLALAVYLRTYQLLPWRRTSELMQDLFGQAPCQATVAAAMETASAALAPVEEQIRAAIHQIPVVHFDETGLRAEAKLHWLLRYRSDTETASKGRLTFYGVHPKRGRQATDAFGILPGFLGTSVHDAWAAYLSYPARHALCNAHLLRELISLDEATHQSWVQPLIKLLIEMKHETETIRRAGRAALDEALLDQLHHRYDSILSEGRAANPPSDRAPAPSGRRPGRAKHSDAENLLCRLQKHAGAVLRFLYDLSVPFDNNLAERDLRMMKVQGGIGPIPQKISGGFRSQAGAAVFCRIRGYFSTLRKQNEPLLSALRSTFLGTPFMPQLHG